MVDDHIADDYDNDDDDDDDDNDDDDNDDDNDNDDDHDDDLSAPPSQADDGGPVCSAKVDSWKISPRLGS